MRKKLKDRTKKNTNWGRESRLTNRKGQSGGEEASASLCGGIFLGGPQSFFKEKRGRSSRWREGAVSCRRLGPNARGRGPFRREKRTFHRPLAEKKYQRGPAIREGKRLPWRRLQNLSSYSTAKCLEESWVRAGGYLREATLRKRAFWP